MNTYACGAAKALRRWALAALLGLGCQASWATMVSESYLQGLIPMAPDAIATVGADLFGDKVNLYNGALTFEHTDFSLPGNSKLPVALTRRATPGRSEIVRGQFADWDLEVPRMTGTFANPGWVNMDGTATRCTQGTVPPASGSASGTDYWQGNYINVPGAGSQEVMHRASGFTAAPADGHNYRFVTQNNWQIRCLPTIQNGAGEGFVAVSPEGVKYRFDWMARRVTVFSKVQAYDHFLFATEVTDRFGNWVRYTFDPANPLLLTRIEANDGRVITVQNAGGVAVSASDGTRTFNYGYGGAFNDLSYVQQPDGSSWSFNLGPMRDPNLMLQGENANCNQPGHYDTALLTGTITHPSGAVGSFVHAFRGHGKTHVQQACKYVTSPQHTTGAVWPKLTMSHTLLSKSISGPGLPTLNWNYAYSSAHCWLPGSGVTGAVCSTHSDRKTVTVTKPDGFSDRHIFGNRWRVTEGQLLELQEGWNGTSALRTTTYRYRLPAGQAYPEQFGTQLLVTSDWLASRHRPMDQKVVTQQGATFTWELASGSSGLDALARPLYASQTSSLGYSKAEATQYWDHLGLWVMGQVASVTTSDGVRASTTYDANTALPTSYSEFGRLLQTYAHHGDGSLYRAYDPLGRPTSWTNYVRGQAQNINFRDGAQESAVINNLGKPTSHTNAAGTTTAYSYDTMGRLLQITPPAEAGMSYHPIQSYFEQIPWAEYGLGVGHWRQTVIKGNARTVRYYDALWRVRVAHTYDAGTANTNSLVEYRYDSEGRKTFESYPQSSLVGVDMGGPGKTWVFDALDRETAMHQSSELGMLTTTTQYLSGFQKLVTNPRGHATTFAFQAFDQPSEEVIAAVWSPESVWLQINRDIHGKPNAIVRGGHFGGNPQQATRSYVYDSHKRLCKTIEPETGATVQAYDAAGNVAWRASGLSLPSGSCDQGSVPEASKVSFGYDARDRLTSTTFADGSQSYSRSYTPDGKLQQVVASGGGVNTIAWNYGYNNRRLLVSEGYGWLADPNWSGWTFHWSIDAHGNVSELTDPWGGMAYAPNALGQATQVSGYASGVTYHPNGVVAGYTLANGVAHSVSLNARGLPEVWRHAGVSQDRYAYDANGNITGITDEQEGVNTRNMPWYDGLDRLRQANGPWGGGHYEYDALDNIVSSSVGSRGLTHQYDAANRLTALTGSQSLNFGYDVQGNITSRGGDGFTFDIGNRMRSAHGKASYVYDGHGRRNLVWYATGGDYAHQTYTQDGRLRFAWRVSEGYRRHVYLGDKLIAETASTGGTSFFHADALGSPIAKTNAGGGLVHRTRYEPYGATVAGSINPTHIGFTGHVNDVDTGLVYMQQRYYEPLAGRFLSADPVATDTKAGRLFNRFSYAESNPYKYNDPDGRFPQLIDESKNANRPGVGQGHVNSDGGPVRLGPQAERSGNLAAAREANGRSQEVAKPASEGVQKPPVVIGENMKERVIPAAKEIGGHVYKPRGDWTQAKQERWAKDMKREVDSGKRQLVDIGRDPERATPSVAYEIERKIFDGR